MKRMDTEPNRARTYAPNQREITMYKSNTLVLCAISIEKRPLALGFMSKGIHWNERLVGELALV